MNRDLANGVVGRPVERASLEEWITRVAAGQGHAVMIEGEPGIGKSTLLDAGLSHVPADCEVLRGQCDELRVRFPLLVMTGLLGVSVDSADPLRKEAALTFAEPDAATGWNIRASSGDPVAAAVEQLLSLVDRLCARAPLVLVLEDLHWADDATLLLWRRLCQASAQQPLLVIGTRRPVPQRAELDLLQQEIQSLGGAVINLGPLPGASVRTLAADILGIDPGPQLMEQLGLASGNPLYII
jgi:predicted ATPase